MTTKKIFGYVFIVIAIILTIGIVGQLRQFLAAVLGFFRIFTESLDSHQTGQVIGALVYWIAHLGITLALWIYGSRWIKKQQKKTSPE